MKKSVFFLLISTAVFAQESVLCLMLIKNIDRTITNLEQQGDKVSYIEKENLYRNMRTNAGLCLQHCQGEKFAYCNKLIEYIDQGGR